MKATKLMIGDWVKHPVYGNVQVRSIPNGEQIWTPIPLTAEILNKNGFISYQQDRIVIWRNDYSFAIECDLTTWEYYWANGDVKINYVHELQHALRLCGLNNLAEHFKI